MLARLLAMRIAHRLKRIEAHLARATSRRVAAGDEVAWSKRFEAADAAHAAVVAKARDLCKDKPAFLGPTCHTGHLVVGLCQLIEFEQNEAAGDVLAELVTLSKRYQAETADRFPRAVFGLCAAFRKTRTEHGANVRSLD